jgi:hypothetical protein
MWLIRQDGDENNSIEITTQEICIEVENDWLETVQIIVTIENMT